MSNTFRYQNFPGFRFTGLVVLALLTFLTGAAQDAASAANGNPTETGKVTFVRMWPEKKNAEKSRHLLKRAWNSAFGKEEIRLKKPVALAVDSMGRPFILDQDLQTVVEVEDGKAKIAGGLDKKPRDLPSLVCITPFKGNTCLFTDSYNNKIYLLDPDRKSVREFGDSLHLNKPTGIAWSSSTGKLYVSETGEHRILVFDEYGSLLRSFGSRGHGVAQFNFPTHLTCDREGNLYVVDAMNFRIQIFDREGKQAGVFGSNGDATGNFASPKGIAVDSYGHIYVADALYHAIQLFNRQGQLLYLFGEQGSGAGQFWMPSGLFIDRNDHIYVTDTYNSRIQEFELKMGGTK